MILLLSTGMYLYSKKNDEIGRLSYNITHLNDSTTHWINRYNQSVAVNNNLQGTIKEIGITHKNQLDSIEKIFNVKKRQVDAFEKVNTVSVKSIKERIDTVKRGDTTASFTHIEPHLSIVENTIVGIAHLDIHDTVDITIVHTWKRKTFLSPKEYKIQTVTDRPDIIISGLQSVTIIKDKPKIVQKALFIGAGITAGYFLFRK